jgi:uncharacterized protein (DUF952 family)
LEKYQQLAKCISYLKLGAARLPLIYAPLVLKATVLKIRNFKIDNDAGWLLT